MIATSGWTAALGGKLFADKPAYMRVHFYTLWLTSVGGVTGTVTIPRRRYGVWTDAGRLIQQALPTITATPSPPYAGERGSLNLAIPAAVMRRHMRLKVRSKRRDHALHR